ncbi:hypothetical protein KJ903_05745 [Patescibacteria group bacterium]|nr:hypothetical protein [Patescibacteria group bacterium]
MNDQQVKSKIKAMRWEVWLHRPYAFLVTYLMFVGATRRAFAEQGIKGEYPIVAYDSYTWYRCPEMIKMAAAEAGKYLQQKDIFTLVTQCENLYQQIKQETKQLIQADRADALELYQRVVDLILPFNVYIWVAHGCEEYYIPIITEKAKEFVPEPEVEKFVGDISKPTKKTAHNLMEDDIRQGMSLEKLHQEYAWMKARIEGGFAPGFSLEEMKKIRREVLAKTAEKIEQPDVPKSLRDLSAELQELVFLRTFRTDALYELYHLAQPIFARAAEVLGVESIRDCLPGDIKNGKIGQQRNVSQSAILKYCDDIVVSDCPVITSAGRETGKIKGAVAWPGKATGTAKVVNNPQQVDKVNKGDILVTPMTIPAYIVAMNRAVAFVTDEGGITCHAAIIAREMKKPCVIGTKIATQAFKDGDQIEVDADRGIVKKL